MIRSWRKFLHYDGPGKMNSGKFIFALMLCLCVWPVHGQSIRRVRATDLPASWWSRPTAEFDHFVAEIEQRTRERLREGENDHLVAYVLQSSQFTSEPKIEPGLSAMEFVGGMRLEQRLDYLAGRAKTPPGHIPGDVSRRIDAFLQMRPPANGDGRIAYFQDLVAGRGRPYIIAEYERTMRFLYEKESGQRSNHPPADLYQERGYATDTQIETNFPVWTAISVLKALEPKLATDRILIVGPGLDLAPRTGFIDLFPPQSYEPFAIADAVLESGLSTVDRLRIHSVDINPLVVSFFDGFPRRSRKMLSLASGLRRDQISGDVQAYFGQLGRRIGYESTLKLPGPLASHLSKSVLVRQDIADRLTAGEMNIVTERYDPSPEYDLVVATNVLVYFSDEELRLALANICSMLRPGGYLVHNELRPQLESLSGELSLAPVQARSIQISAGTGRPLLDAFVIHRRAGTGIPSVR
jgi:hypothetical protein